MYQENLKYAHVIPEMYQEPRYLGNIQKIYPKDINEIRFPCYKPPCKCKIFVWLFLEYFGLKLSVQTNNSVKIRNSVSYKKYILELFGFG